MDSTQTYYTMDKNDFLREHLYLARYHALRMWPYAKAKAIQFDDLLGEGNVGLMKAYNKYDPAKGYQFSTYASNWIRGAIFYFISNYNMGANFVRPYKDAYQKVQKANLQEASEAEIVEKLGMTEEEAHLAKEFYLFNVPVSTSQVITTKYTEECTIEDTISDYTEVDIEGRLVLEQFIATLSERDQTIVRLYIKEIPMYQIAEVIGSNKTAITRRMTQIREKAQEFGKTKEHMARTQQYSFEDMMHYIRNTDMSYVQISRLTGWSTTSVARYGRSIRGEQRPKKKCATAQVS